MPREQRIEGGVKTNPRTGDRGRAWGGNVKFASMKKEASSDSYLSTAYTTQLRPKLYDPQLGFVNQSIPFNNEDPAQRKVVRVWCRYWYQHHQIVGPTLDIFATFPIVGLEAQSENQEVADYFKKWLQDAKMQQFIKSAGVEYWQLSDAFIAGEFDSEQKKWTYLTIIPHGMVVVEKNQLLTKPAFFLEFNEGLIKMVREQQPASLFKQFNEQYPSIVELVQQGHKRWEIPTEGDESFRFWQWSYGGNPEDNYGTPIMMRVFRPLLSEEKVLQAMDSQYERLNAPILHAQLGEASTPNGEGYTPNDADISVMEGKLRDLMESDVRVFVTPYDVEMKFIQMDRANITFGQDLDRLENKIIMGLGINKAVIQGEAPTYSGASLAADFLIQRFENYRDDVVDWLNELAKEICKANNWFKQDEKTKQPTEEPDIPTWIFKHMDFRDKGALREFGLRLRDAGIISEHTILDLGAFDWDNEQRLLKEEAQKRAEGEAAPKEEKPSEGGGGLNVPSDGGGPAPEEKAPAEEALPEEGKAVAPQAHEVPPVAPPAP